MVAYLNVLKIQEVMGSTDGDLNQMFGYGKLMSIYNSLNIIDDSILVLTLDSIALMVTMGFSFRSESQEKSSKFKH